MIDVKNTANIYTKCTDIINKSWDVSITPVRYSQFDEAFAESPTPVSMDFYLSDPEASREQVFAEFIVASALNGGYWYDTDPVTQWEVGGSGSRALEGWIKKLYKNNLHPYHNEDSEEIIRGLNQGIFKQPNPERRTGILYELAHKLRYVSKSCLERFPYDNKFNFNYSDISYLAKALPNSFGEDPFLKKACLVFLMFAGWLSARDVPVASDLPIPTDYQMPRIFEYEGAIDISNEFRNKLNSGKIIDVTSPEVEAFRAAGILVAHGLAERYGLDDYQIDNVLFSQYRKDKNFIKNSTKPMRCMSMWF